jgi:hypothetical protein
MAERTLSDLSTELEAANKSLDEQVIGQERLIEAVEDLAALQRRNLDDLESEREDRGESTAPITKGPRGSGGSGDGFSLPSIGLGGAGLVGAASAIGTGLVKKGLPAAIAVTMADEIGDYVTSSTGNQELGSAVERGLVAGGIGSLFGKRIGVVAGLVGAALTKENQEKLKELGKNLEPHVQKLKQNVEGLVGKLPTTEEVLTGVEKTFGNALTGLNQLVTGDFSGLTKNLDDLALSAAGIFALLAPKSALNLGIKGVTAAAGLAAAPLGGKPKATPTGQKVAPKGTAYSKAGNLMKAGVDGKATSIPADAKTVSKFPKLGKALKFVRGIPGLGAALAVGELASMNPITVDGLAGVFGGLGGSTLGALAGGIVGSVVPGPGNLVGSILGGGAGFFLGDSIAKGLAQFLLDKKVDAFPDWTGINDILNGQTASATSPTTPVTPPTGVDGGLASAVASASPTTMAPPSRSDGASVAQSVNQFEMNKQAASNPIVNAPQTTINQGTSQTTLAGNGVNPFDPRRPNLVGLPTSF